tara:strand:+ start:373 stop:801 length:429 start_codon:yes stop_codon:yes gene_type:complete
MYIYKIISKQSDECYVGKTYGMLQKRLLEHKLAYMQWLEGSEIFRSSFHILEYDDCEIELIEQTTDGLREIYWIQKLNSVNHEYSGDYYITKIKEPKCKDGIIYDFHIRRGNKSIIRKSNTNLEELKEFRDNWLNNNKHYFK